MNVKYSIKEVYPQIFAVIVPDKYDRAMTFCRVQEFYESPSKKFHGRKFCMWEYMKWYAKKSGAFTYPRDWSGFNVPLKVAIKVAESCSFPDCRFPTFYDDVFKNIVSAIEDKSGGGSRGYVIGTDGKNGTVLNHEVCHGKYFLSEDYRKLADQITLGRSMKPYYQQLKENIIGMGYNAKVVNDEIQAYCQYGFEECPPFRKNVQLEALTKLSREYNEQLINF